MKDIKIKNKKVNKIPEKTVVVYETKPVLVKKKTNVFPVILFGFMTTSILCYVFLVSSSIFYAVRTSQYEFQAGQVGNVISSAVISQSTIEKNDSARVSYINKDSDTSISLK
jgi:uncharacterized membrane protein